MAKKNRCYLCGGKLLDGYCPDCGLDNTRIHRRHYHLNESYVVKSINGDERKASVKCKEKTGQEKKKDGMSAHKTVQNKKQDAVRQDKYVLRNGNRYRMPAMPPVSRTGGETARATKTSGKTKLVVIGGILLFVIASQIPKYAVSFETVFHGEQEAEMAPYDPYEYVERELPETGDYYETELTQGEYLVGVHLPEGNYIAELLEGNGTINVDDSENGIYLWQAFGTREEYGDVEILEDIRLYQGAHVTVDNGVCLRMTTENGQAENMESVENPLTEIVELKKDRTMSVGKDLLEGVYDISVASGWAYLRCRIPDEGYVEGYYEKSYWLGEDTGEDVYCNVYLKEGVEITAEENTILLVPSPWIGSGDYEEYYRYY